MDYGSVRGDGHNLEVEEGVGKKSSIDDENSTNEQFGENKTSGKVKHISCEDKDCTKKFTVQRLMRKHMLSEHDVGVSQENKDRYVCGECGRKCMNAYNLENHIAAHNRTYDCEQCGKQLKSKAGLYYHIKNHKGVRDYKCN